MKKIFKNKQLCKLILAFTLLFVFNIQSFSASYIWTGATSNAWALNSNWNPSTGYPGASDNATFNSGCTKYPVLTGDVSVTKLTMNTGAYILDLGGYQLNASGTSTIAGGTATNGTINLSGATNITGGTFSSGNLNINGNTTISGGTFSSALAITNSTISLTGVTFDGALTISTNGNSLQMSNCTFNNTFNFTKTGTPIAYVSGGNTYNNTVVVANLGSGDIHFSSVTNEVFNANLTVEISGTGNIYLADNGTNTQFNGNIILNNTTSGNIYFGAAGGTSSLANGKSFSVGVAGWTSNGSLYIYNLTQSDASTAQTITMAGLGANIYFESGTSFAGNLAATADNLYLGGATFSGSCNFTKTGSSANSWTGGDHFTNSVIINLSGTGNLHVSSVTSDIFDANLTANSTNTGSLYLADNGINTQFKGNIILNNTATGKIYFGASGGTSTLASGKTFSVGATGWTSSGSLYIFNLTQSDAATAQSITLTGSGATVYFETGTTFAGNFTLSSDNSYFDGATFSGITNFTKTGNSLNDCVGGNHFIGSSNSFTTTVGADRWRFANTNPDVFNNATFTHNGTSNFIVARQSQGNIFNGTTHFLSNSVGGIFVTRSNTSHNGSATFNGPVVVNLTLTGNITFAEGSSSILDTCYFNNTISLNSTNTSTGDVFFCTESTGGKCILNSGSAFIAGSLNGQTNVTLRNLTQLGSTGQVINTAGSTGYLYLGTTSSGVYYGNTFNGACTISSDTSMYAYGSNFNSTVSVNVNNIGGSCYLYNNIFNAGTTVLVNRIVLSGNTFGTSTNITQTGSMSSINNGNNIFNGPVTITNSGTNSLRLSNTVAGDTYNSDATFVQSGASGCVLSPAHSYSTIFKGNISTTGSTAAVSFAVNGGVVLINGTLLQQITDGYSLSPTIGALTINNSAGLTINVPVSITSNLTLTSGLINTNSTNLLTLKSGAITNVGNASSYVNGALAYVLSGTGASTLNLPIGKGSDWRPAVLTPTHGNTTSYTYIAEIFNSSASALGWTKPVSITGVSRIHYMDINRTITSSGIASNANLTSAIVQMYYSNTGNDDKVTDYLNITIAKAPISGSAWTDIAGSATANGSGSVTSGTFNSSGRFALANKIGGNNDLPIEFLNFTVTNKNGSAYLEWSTASEINNNFYSVEKSRDGVLFEEIDTLNGAGYSINTNNYNFIDAKPFEGITYYRIKQTDFDGKFEYSETKFIENNSIENYFNISPNPVFSDRNITIVTNQLKNDNFLITILNLEGKIYYKEKIIVNNENLYKINLGNNIRSGFYLLNISGENLYINKKLIVE